MKTYRTIQGDTFDGIAQKQLGSSGYTDLLMRCNPQYIGAMMFNAGVILELPDVATETNKTDTLPPWKKVAG